MCTQYERADYAEGSRTLTYAEKHMLADREAKYSLVALLSIIAVWILLGFGVAYLQLSIGSIPLWIISSSIGTWLWACIVSLFLVKKVFVNFSLDTPEESS